MKKDTILVIGACGQIGAELTSALQKKFGIENVIAADIHLKHPGIVRYVCLDVLDHQKLETVITENGVTQIYLMAAMLPAAGEKNANAAWKLNMQSLLSVLEIAKGQQLDKIFWPSSIAVFGPGSPKHLCPQETLIEPNTIYGINKRAGEHLCKYYFEKYGVDVRSLRYPGLISYTTPPGGGITDYTVEIFHHALEGKNYSCYLKEDTCLPMMYMADAIRATIEIMDAPKESIKVRNSYNISGLSFSPCDLAAAIKQYFPGFEVTYHFDYRQAIADSWPASICDLEADRDWKWRKSFNLDMMVNDMLYNFRLQKGKGCTTADNYLPVNDFEFTRIEEK
jgi:nucleoside-diphosphate-sugar epimerase